MDRELKPNPQLDPPARFPGAAVRPVDGRFYFDPKVGLVSGDDGRVVSAVEPEDARAERLEKYAAERAYRERQAGIHRPEPIEGGVNVWPRR